MGIKLKEALKRICNSNQWSYAVFWRIDGQNPKLLIWEESHYEPSPSSPPAELENENEVCLLMNKMMLSNRINVVGEGIVGRAAFSGNHFWILSDRNTHSPEVLNELHHQFSSGMQTIAVIPVFPRGVVQLGSPLAIAENMRFVDEVKSLILHSGSVHGDLLPENYPRKESGEVLKSSMAVDGYSSGYSSLLSETVDHNLNLPISSLNCCNPNASSLHGEWFDLLTSFGSPFDFRPPGSEGSGFERGGDDNPSAMNLGVGEDALFSDSYNDHLLDAVVSGRGLSANRSSGDDASQKTSLTQTSSGSPSPFFGCGGMSDHRRRDLFEIPSQSSNSGTLDARSTSSPSNSVYGSQIGSWGERGKSVGEDKCVSTAYSERPTEVNKSNRKRPKPGESSRPRPKDRQLFQDRLKELREIVPNGAKYSIDALLERTVKHMLFLQSVTKHADKLKQSSEAKRQSTSKEGGLFLKHDLEGGGSGGATWAFEVGSESMVCPLIVKDLNPPRQMLVEMLCEGRGFFLEIADLVRGLGLTILKGVMETRNDKIWARFAVEANRDVTRMEIFMLLVHLLEQSMKGGGPCLADAADINDNHLMVRNSWPQTAPIPATGRIK